MRRPLPALPPLAIALLAWTALSLFMVYWFQPQVYLCMGGVPPEPLPTAECLAYQPANLLPLAFAVIVLGYLAILTDGAWTAAVSFFALITMFAWTSLVIPHVPFVQLWSTVVVVAVYAAIAAVVAFPADRRLLRLGVVGAMALCLFFVATYRPPVPFNGRVHGCFIPPRNTPAGCPGLSYGSYTPRRSKSGAA